MLKSIGRLPVSYTHLVSEMVSGILPVRLTGVRMFHCGIWDDLVEAIGTDNFFFFFAEDVYKRQVSDCPQTGPVRKIKRAARPQQKRMAFYGML